MTGLPPPNHTQVPNILLDKMMLDMSESELKVTLAIVRKTLGWHKKKDQISYSQLEKLTGMGRQAVSTGIEAALKRGLIEIVGTGSRGVNIFGLVIDDQYENQTSDTADQYENQTTTGMKIKHTKETTQKKKDISSDDDAQEIPEKPKKQREPNPLFDAVAQYVFEIAPDELKDEGGRIGILSSWLSGKSDGVKHGKSRVTVGFISAPAKPEHVMAFASYWKSSSSANIPYDLVKFVDAWRKWVSGLKTNGVRRVQQNNATIPEVKLSDNEIEARRQQIAVARKGEQSL